MAQNPSVTVDYSVLDDIQPKSGSALNPAKTPAVMPAPAPVAQAMSSKSAPTDVSGLFGAEWSGRANAGLDIQSGNSETQDFKFDVSAKGKWDKSRLTLKADYNRGEDDGEVTTDKRSATALYDYFYAEKWFVNTNLKLEQDDLAEIDLRTVAGLGIGHQPFESEELNLQYVLGVNYINEELENGTSEDDIALRWSLDYDQKIWDDFLTLYHEHELLVPTDETDAYLFDSKSGIRAPLHKSLIASAEIEYDRDNAPPVGVKKDDTTYTIKLGYEW